MQHRFRYNTYIILEHLHCILALLFSLNDYKKKNMLSIFTSITLNNYLIKWNTFCQVLLMSSGHKERRSLMPDH